MIILIVAFAILGSLGSGAIFLVLAMTAAASGSTSAARQNIGFMLLCGLTLFVATASLLGMTGS